MIETTIRTSRGVPYTMQLERNPAEDNYVVGFYAQRNDVRPQCELHPFKEFDDAYNCYVRNAHYYNDVRLEPLSEEAFLGLPPGFLFGNRNIRVRRSENA